MLRFLCKLRLHWWTETLARPGWDVYKCSRCGAEVWVRA